MFFFLSFPLDDLIVLILPSNLSLLLWFGAVMDNSTAPFFSCLDSDPSTGYLQDALVEFSDRSKRRRLLLYTDHETNSPNDLMKVIFNFQFFFLGGFIGFNYCLLEMLERLILVVLCRPTGTWTQTAPGTYLRILIAWTRLLVLVEFQVLALINVFFSLITFVFLEHYCLSSCTTHVEMHDPCSALPTCREWWCSTFKHVSIIIQCWNCISFLTRNAVLDYYWCCFAFGIIVMGLF